MARRRSWRGVKLHRSYTYDEAARALGIHKNTVAEWVKRRGLPALTEKKPHLILGRDLIEHLVQRKDARRKRLKPGEMFCMTCKAARRPAAGMVEELPTRSGAAHLSGLCEACTGVMTRRVRRVELPAFLDASVASGNAPS